MANYRVLPPRALRGLVHSLSTWEGGQPAAGRMAVMATPAVSLQINLDDDELCWYDGDGGVHALNGVTVSGPQSRAFAIDAWQPRIVRVVFRPGGAVPFLRVSPGELRDTHVSLEDILGRDARRLRHILAHAAEPGETLSILGRALAAMPLHDQVPRPAIGHALRIARAHPNVTVADLAARTGLSPKRFITLFTHQVGLTPKVFLRVERFRRVLADLRGSTTANWVDMAAEHGYFDQSHMIRDFHEFAGRTPAAYLAQRGPDEYHVIA